MQGLGAEIHQDRTAQEGIAADGTATKELNDFARTFEQDGDYATFGERADKGMAEIKARNSLKITDVGVRKRWEADFDRRMEPVRNKITGLGEQKVREGRLVEARTGLEGYKSVIADASATNEDRERAKTDANASIDVLQQSGLLDPSEADDWRRSIVQGGQFVYGQRVLEKDPEAITGKLPSRVADRAGMALKYFQSRGWTPAQAAGIVGNLLAESSLNPGSNNPRDGRDGSDSIGIGQWNSDRARALKDFASANNADWQDFNVQLAFVEHELNGAESAAGSQLRNAKDVQEATEAFIMYERPRGSDKGAKSAHNYNGRLRYAQQAAGETIRPDWYTSQPPERQLQLEKYAEARGNEMSAEYRGNIETVIQNAPVAIQNAGSYGGALPTEDDFVAAYGRDGPARFDAFQTSIDVAEKSHDFRTMSAEEIQRTVAEAVPTSTGDNAALEAKRFNALSEAASTTLAARKSDPAAYVRQVFPAVQETWQASIDDGDFQRAYNTMASAQQQLGIQNMQLLPKQLADTAVSNFKNDASPGVDRLNAVAGLIFATSDTGQRQAVFKQLVDAGLPPTMEGVFEAVARGDQGAATRLMEAVVADPAKLPNSGETTSAALTEEVYERVWAPGQVGFTAYGISFADASSLERAQRGTELITKAARIRMARGENLQSAIDGARQDLFGNTVVFERSGVLNAEMVIDRNIDQAALYTGLVASKQVFADALEQERAVELANRGATVADKNKAQENVPGLVEKGNIDLTSRPQVRNEDGSVSTVRSISFEEDGIEILVPTVSNDGQVMSDDEAIAQYRKTGQFLGKFQTPEEATQYAEALHQQQERYYTMDPGLRAILNVTTENRVNDIISNGVFVEIKGGIGLRDPYTGQFVLGTDGKPLTVQMQDAVTRGNELILRNASGTIKADQLGGWATKMQRYRKELEEQRQSDQ